MSFSSLPNGGHDVKPFKIDVPKDALEELKTLIKYSKVAIPTFENTQKDGKYGLSREWVEGIKAKWEKFDWTQTEDRLNKFPHFIANVKDDDGTAYDIHFAALFSKKTDAVPLMLLHGWPGSFLEFMPILQLLKDKYTPDSLPYQIIVPSLPGYAFSSGPRLNEDFGIEDIARLLDRLMSILGFSSGYICQGGDIGSRVARYLAYKFPNCKAAHVNLLLIPQPPNTSIDDLTEVEKVGVERGARFRAYGSAYAMEHATKPSTIGFVLASSPMALMAWIGEKFQGWTDETPSDEEIIETVSLYWLTDTFPRCIYPYRQTFLSGGTQPATGFIDKPLGYSSFSKELAVCPKSWAETHGNLVFYREHDKGGHFAAFEQPETMLKDVEDFVRQAWKK